jgi:hypothetical protein
MMEHTVYLSQLTVVLVLHLILGMIVILDGPHFQVDKVVMELLILMVGAAQVTMVEMEDNIEYSIIILG